MGILLLAAVKVRPNFLDVIQEGPHRAAHLAGARACEAKEAGRHVRLEGWLVQQPLQLAQQAPLGRGRGAPLSVGGAG